MNADDYYNGVLGRTGPGLWFEAVVRQVRLYGGDDALRPVDVSDLM